jgi:hypothetical protein
MLTTVTCSCRMCPPAAVVATVIVIWLPTSAQDGTRSGTAAPAQDAAQPAIPGAPSDAQTLKARWRDQQVVALRAEGEYHQARIAREIAEIGVVQFQEGFVAARLATVASEIKLAEIDLQNAEGRVEWARRNFEKGYISSAAKNSEELNLKNARTALELAQAKRDRLINYAPGKDLQARADRAQRRESDRLEVVGYSAGSVPADLATADGEIHLAESDVKRAEDRLDWARRMFDKGRISVAAKNSEEFNFRKARLALEQAHAKRLFLVSYAQGKTLTELQAQLDVARARELDAKMKWEREKADAARLERLAARAQVSKANSAQP